MKMFIGSLDWAADQMVLNCDRENLIVTCEKRNLFWEVYLRMEVFEHILLLNYNNSGNNDNIHDNHDNNNNI
jgi:hypothetical protein